ncbi:MAG TPA: hypothetical protein VGI39_34840, partial [Polyangiaceae bacterium]
MSIARDCACLALLAAAGLLGGCSSSDGSGSNSSPAPSSGGGADAGGGMQLGSPTTDSGAPMGNGNGTSDAGTDGAPPPPAANCPPSWTTTPACGGGGAGGAAPDFGPNVLIFDPSTTDVQSQLDKVNGQMEADQFGTGRYAYFFKPGKYNADVKVGFYTQLVGLGQSPDDVEITGAVRSKADWLGGNNATCNFWRGAENFAVVPTQDIDNGVIRWAVSQGTHLRRAHIKGTIDLDDNGWSSGGFIADSLIDQQINSGSQQQFLTRNDDLTNWSGQNWNMVFVGDNQAPANAWPDPPYTTVDKTPLVREKPFLYVDSGGHYLVMVPALKTASQGRSWQSSDPPGSPVSIDRFYLAKPDTDNASTLNAALAQGKHLLFTPGIYHLTSALHVTTPGTILMGLGFATLIPDSGNGLLNIDDVDDVSVASLLLEAGPKSSPVLMQVGPTGSTQSHAAHPTVLFDLHCRIGGADVGTADNCLTINSSDVIVDNTWLWRADHGAGADWNTNKSKNGIIVNGANVTIYGLFVEHFQEFQTLWNGEGGQVFFYQSEMPYDPPSQDQWMEAPGKNGYPSYKVADGVKTHSAQGLGVYSVFQNDVQAANALETPAASGVVMHHMVSVSLAGGSIAAIINGTGGTVG